VDEPVQGVVALLPGEDMGYQGAENNRKCAIVKVLTAHSAGGKAGSLAQQGG